MRSAVGLSISLPLTLLLGPLLVHGEPYAGGYPDYEDQGIFTAPCGRKHTGSDTRDLTEFMRHKPVPPTWIPYKSVSSHPKDYIWAEYGPNIEYVDDSGTTLNTCAPDDGASARTSVCNRYRGNTLAIADRLHAPFFCCSGWGQVKWRGLLRGRKIHIQHRVRCIELLPMGRRVPFRCRCWSMPI